MLAAIVAMGTNGVIGRDGGLPWRLPAEMAHFKRTTMGRVVLMGRRTWDELGRPLPGRTNIVITRTPGWSAPGAHAATSLEEALALAARLAGPDAQDPDRCPVVIGGGEIYRLALPHTDRLYLTTVQAAPEGDTSFPPLDPTEWSESARTDHPADARNPHAFTIRVLDRRRPR